MRGSDRVLSSTHGSPDLLGVRGSALHCKCKLLHHAVFLGSMYIYSKEPGLHAHYRAAHPRQMHAPIANANTACFHLMFHIS